MEIEERVINLVAEQLGVDTHGPTAGRGDRRYQTAVGTGQLTNPLAGLVLSGRGFSNRTHQAVLARIQVVQDDNRVKIQPAKVGQIEGNFL